MMKHHFYKLIVLLILLMGVFGCISKKTAVNDTVDDVFSPTLIFLNYNISKAENNKKTVEFISKKITDGKIKNSSNKYIEIGYMGDLKCSQINIDSVELTSVIIKDPLSKILEFVNDSLIFESKKLELEKSFFSLRLQLHSETAYVVIKEIKDSLQNYNTLNIIKLDLKND